MSCLSVGQLYLYLEKEMSSSEKKEVEYHLSKCLKCRSALEERKILLQAAESLPSFEVPLDFAQNIMSRIFPPKVSFRGWLLAFSVGFGAFILTSLTYLLTSGQSLTSLFTRIFHSLWEQGMNVSLFFVKLFKLASLFFTVISQLLGQLFQTLRFLTALISPEVQIIIVTTALILITVFIYGMRKKLVFGEKQ